MRVDLRKLSTEAKRTPKCFRHEIKLSGTVFKHNCQNLCKTVCRFFFFFFFFLPFNFLGQISQVGESKLWSKKETSGRWGKLVDFSPNGRDSTTPPHTPGKNLQHAQITKLNSVCPEH